MNDERNLEETVAEIQSKAKRVQQELASTQGTGTSSNGAVNVVVDASGRLRDIAITSAAYSRPKHLPALILEAAAAAEADAARRATEVLRPLTSDDRIGPAMQAFNREFGAVALDKVPVSDDDAYFHDVEARGWMHD